MTMILRCHSCGAVVSQDVEIGAGSSWCSELGWTFVDGFFLCPRCYIPSEM